MSAAPVGDEYPIEAVASELWASRRGIALLAFAGVCAMLLLSFIIKPTYQADAVVLVLDRSQLSGNLAQFGALASTLGLSLGANDESQEPVAVLRSRKLAADFITENGLTAELAAPSAISAFLGRLSGSARNAPDLRDAVRRFDRHIRDIDVEKKTGLVTISASWRDPATAANWANKIVELLNRDLREQAMRESSRSISYLRAQISETSIVSIQQSLSQLMEQQMDKYVLAQGREDYALRIIDPAVAPKHPSFPQPIPMTIVGLVAGTLLGAVRVLVRMRLRGRAAARKSDEE